MANFVTRELNLVFSWIDHKLNFHITKSFDEAHIWKACVMTCTSLIEEALDHP